MCIPTLQICGFTPGTSRVFRSRSEQKPQRPSQSCEPSGHTSIEPKAASQHKPWVHESKASRAKCLMIWGGLRRTWASAPSQKKMSRKASRCRDQWAGSSWRSKPCFESEVESAKNELMPETSGYPTGQDVGNMAYRISGTIEPKNQKVGRNMEIWVSEVPLIEIAMNYSSWGTLRRPLIRTATWKCRPLEQLFISLFTQWNKLADMKCFKI